MPPKSTTALGKKRARPSQSADSYEFKVQADVLDFSGEQLQEALTPGNQTEQAVLAPALQQRLLEFHNPQNKRYVQYVNKITEDGDKHIPNDAEVYTVVPEYLDFSGDALSSISSSTGKTGEDRVKASLQEAANAVNNVVAKNPHLTKVAVPFLVHTESHHFTVLYVFDVSNGGVVSGKKLYINPIAPDPTVPNNLENYFNGFVDTIKGTYAVEQASITDKGQNDQECGPLAVYLATCADPADDNIVNTIEKEADEQAAKDTSEELRDTVFLPLTKYLRSHVADPVDKARKDFIAFTEDSARNFRIMCYALKLDDASWEAFLNEPLANGKTPIEHAIEQGWPNTVDALFESGAELPWLYNTDYKNNAAYTDASEDVKEQLDKWHGHFNNIARLEQLRPALKLYTRQTHGGKTFWSLRENEDKLATLDNSVQTTLANIPGEMLDGDTGTRDGSFHDLMKRIVNEPDAATRYRNMRQFFNLDHSADVKKSVEKLVEGFDALAQLKSAQKPIRRPNGPKNRKLPTSKAKKHSPDVGAKALVAQLDTYKDVIQQVNDSNTALARWYAANKQGLNLGASDLDAVLNSPAGAGPLTQVDNLNVTLADNVPGYGDAYQKWLNGNPQDLVELITTNDQVKQAVEQSVAALSMVKKAYDASEVDRRAQMETLVRSEAEVQINTVDSDFQLSAAGKAKWQAAKKVNGFEDAYFSDEETLITLAMDNEPVREFLEASYEEGRESIKTWKAKPEQKPIIRLINVCKQFLVDSLKQIVGGNQIDVDALKQAAPPGSEFKDCDDVAYDRFVTGISKNLANAAKGLVENAEIVAEDDNNISGNKLLTNLLKNNFSTRYLEDQYQQYTQEHAEGIHRKHDLKYGGIGTIMVMEQNKGIIIEKVFGNSPAAEKRLEDNDVVTKLYITAKDWEFINKLKDSGNAPELKEALDYLINNGFMDFSGKGDGSTVIDLAALSQTDNNLDELQKRFDFASMFVRGIPGSTVELEVEGKDNVTLTRELMNAKDKDHHAKDGPGTHNFISHADRVTQGSNQGKGNSPPVVVSV